jgi:superfamily II DNA or RNA helicase
MEYVINKQGNWGQIYPVPEGKLAFTLDKYMSYERPGKQFMPNPEWAQVHLYRAKTGRFPWGLKYIVKAIFEKYCNTVPGQSYKINFLPILVTHIAYDPMRSLRPYQREAIHALIGNYGGIIVLPTGSGKTLTLIEYLKIMGMKALVLVPTIDIRRQWDEYKLPNVTVSTYQNPKLKLKGVMESFDILVCDECHHASAKTIYNLAMSTKTDAIIIGCSATINREDGEDLKVYGALGRIIYKISRRELIDQGFLANARVVYLKPKFQTDGKYMDYQKVYNLEIIHNESRNNLIISAALADARNQRKILILVSTIEHGEIILGKLEPFKDIKTIFMNGQSKNRGQDMSKWNIIIATSIYDEGYNLPSLDTLILAGSGKSKIKVTQRVGRVLRVKPDGRTAIIYDFIDTPKFLKRQYQTRRKQLGEEFEVFEVDEQSKLKLED